MWHAKNMSILFWFFFFLTIAGSSEASGPIALPSVCVLLLWGTWLDLTESSLLRAHWTFTTYTCWNPFITQVGSKVKTEGRVRCRPHLHLSCTQNRLGQGLNKGCFHSGQSEGSDGMSASIWSSVLSCYVTLQMEGNWWDSDQQLLVKKQAVNLTFLYVQLPTWVFIKEIVAFPASFDCSAKKKIYHSYWALLSKYLLFVFAGLIQFSVDSRVCFSVCSEGGVKH